MVNRSVPRRPTLLIILDGVGVNPSRINNAVQEADTPRLDEYFSRNSHTTLDACGTSVGLPDGQMGNSEVGHEELQREHTHIVETVEQAMDVVGSHRDQPWFINGRS